MQAIEERIRETKERLKKLEQQQRAEKRKEQKVELKKNQRRNYIVGELVTKYFPEIKDLEPGTKAENMVRFEPLERILSALSADTQLIEQLKQKAVCPDLADRKSGNQPSSDYPECVSGHRQKPGGAYAPKGGDGRG